MNGLSNETFLRQLYFQEKSQSKFYNSAPIFDQKARSKCLALIQKMASHFKQRQKTTHLAIQYLDIMLLNEFLFSNFFTDSDFFEGSLSPLKFDEYLLSCTAMLLASKFYEPDENLIMISELQQYMKRKEEYRMNYEHMQRCEVQALTALEWDLFRVIPIDFLQTYQLVYGLISDSDNIMQESNGVKTRRLKRYRSSEQKTSKYGQICDLKQVQESVQANVVKISDVVMENHFEFVGQKPSVIAIAIIDRARAQSDIQENNSYLQQYKQDLLQIQSCKNTINKLMGWTSSFVSELPPCERSKSFILTIGENSMSNSEPNEETKPTLVTLTSAINNLPKQNSIRSSQFTSNTNLKKKVFKTKTEMQPLVLRPQTQIVSQSQSISPVKAQTIKIQQKLEQPSRMQVVSPVEINYKDQKQKKYQNLKSIKSDERNRPMSFQLDHSKVQSIKSISPVKNKVIIEKNASKKDTNNTSNAQGGMSSPQEPQYFCFNDFEQPKMQKQASNSSNKKLLFHKQKSSIFSKNYGSSGNQSKSPKNDQDLSRNHKSQLLHKKGQQSIFKTSKKPNDYSQKLLQNINKGLNSIEAKPSGLGLGQANKRISNNAHKLRLSCKFNSDQKEVKKSVIDNVYSAQVKPFQIDENKINDINASKPTQKLSSAQKIPQNITPKNIQFSAMSKYSSSSKKNYHPKENISLFNRCRQSNIPSSVKTSIIERRQIDLRTLEQKSAKKGLQPTQNLTTKVFEIQLDIESCHSEDHFNDSTIIEANEDEPIVKQESQTSSQEWKRRTKQERKSSKKTNK